ncbi:MULTISPECIES: hypothetical protein [unclassified Sulfurimonas]|jgi:hypothetical protein|uniref:hypothetical protein n=1 Tax=unclassified Sulfurimonas TaxID=2623549 RepID=UPI0008C23C22|nr:MULTISPECIES: hypothetical protein [unclassified Sulfurimonas]MBS4067809.1 hypothetical protein [Sulfurimonas sp.]MDD3855974.1 hypothetical protein [Sulfurimonas sp.]OHE05066.1 MAG: hypothetical protein A2345_06885 [Sulfurimonas sp. RIFOXYB12_FULL_35_9]
MQASFVLDSNELDYSFIDKLREMFQNKRIELFVSETDDTEYLYASKTNKDILMKSTSNIANGENLVIADPKLFQ